MKRGLSFVLVLVTMFSLAVPAFAAEVHGATTVIGGEEPRTIYDVPTNENAMPSVSVNMYQTNSTQSSNPRAEWINDTTEVLEEAYNQEVVSVTEDDNYITFHYAYDEDKLEEGQLSVTKYLKPESALATSANVATKLNYAWGWDRDYYYSNDKKSAANFQYAVSTMLTLFADTVFEYSLGSLLSMAVDLLGINADYAKAVTAENTVKFYYCNKIGYVQDTVFGYWLPYAYVGERRAFNRVQVVYYDYAGQPRTGNPIEQYGYPSNNPTNYAKREKKAHYDDDSWIINRALTQYLNDDGVYSSIYETVGNLCDEMP